MDTETHTTARKKPGPKPKNYRRVNVHFYLDPEDYAWLKDHPEGLAVSMRRAIKEYRQREEPDPRTFRPDVVDAALARR